MKENTKTGDTVNIVKETQYPSCPLHGGGGRVLFSLKDKGESAAVSVSASCLDYWKKFAILIGLSKPVLCTLSFLWNRSHIIFHQCPALGVFYLEAILRRKLFLELGYSITISIP